MSSKKDNILKFNQYMKSNKMPYPPGIRRRSDVSVRSHINREFADHIETS